MVNKSDIKEYKKCTLKLNGLTMQEFMLAATERNVTTDLLVAEVIEFVKRHPEKFIKRCDP